MELTEDFIVAVYQEMDEIKLFNLVIDEIQFDVRILHEREILFELDVELILLRNWKVKLLKLLPFFMLLTMVFVLFLISHFLCGNEFFVFLLKNEARRLVVLLNFMLVGIKETRLTEEVLAAIMALQNSKVVIALGARNHTALAGITNFGDPRLQYSELYRGESLSKQPVLYLCLQQGIQFFMINSTSAQLFVDKITIIWFFNGVCLSL